jgi:hypothetical protein
MDLTNNDYKELSTYTLDQLIGYYNELNNVLVDLLNEYNKLTILEKDNQLSEDILETQKWLFAYNTEINSRYPQKTITCNGCSENQPNQQAHFGGCLPDPYSSENYLQADKDTNK